MPSDFVESGKRLETSIRVTDVPLSRIRERARRAHVSQRLKLLIGSAATVAVLGSGTVFAAMHGGVKMWLSGDRAAISMHSFTVSQVDASTLRHVAQTAAFPVVLPVGIPRQWRLMQVAYAPSDHPNFIDAMYRDSKTASLKQVVMVESSTVVNGLPPALPNGEAIPSGNVIHWNVGEETVILVGGGSKDAIEAAMASTTPEASLSQNLARLPRVRSLGGEFDVFVAAEALSPADGTSTLVDRGHLADIANLARSHSALTYRVSNIFEDLPSVNGRADFSRAKVRAENAVAVSPGGVRALAAVLDAGACGRGGRMGSAFTCETLINERSGRPYWVWAIPIHSSASPTKYRVDRSTYEVTRE